jgi:hypothetical protein
LCEEIALDPFSESEVADDVRDDANDRHRRSSCALHERTDGPPLFVASVMTE